MSLLCATYILGKKTITAHVDVPEMWLVTTAVALYDMVWGRQVQT